MSLTSHLSRKDSPVTRHFDAIIDERAARRFTQQVNDYVEAAARRQGGLVLVAGTVPTLAGSAFDFGFRHWLQPFSREHLPRVAVKGARQAEANGWPNAFRILAAILQGLPEADEMRQAQAFVALAVFERYFRALGAVLAARDPAGEDLPARLLADPPQRPSHLMARLPEATVRDVAALLAAARQHWPAFHGQPFVSNPTFALSAGVGGADADWVLGGVLHECKVSYQARPVEKKHIRQLLGYLLLDADDALGLTSVGFLLPRQRACPSWSVPAFLRGLGIRDELPVLRERFAAILAAEQARRQARTEVVERRTEIDPETGRVRRIIRVTLRQGDAPPSDTPLGDAPTR